MTEDHQKTCDFGRLWCLVQITQITPKRIQKKKNTIILENLKLITQKNIVMVYFIHSF